MRNLYYERILKPLYANRRRSAVRLRGGVGGLFGFVRMPAVIAAVFRHMNHNRAFHRSAPPSVGRMVSGEERNFYSAHPRLQRRKLEPLPVDAIDRFAVNANLPVSIAGDMFPGRIPVRKDEASRRYMQVVAAQRIGMRRNIERHCGVRLYGVVRARCVVMRGGRRRYRSSGFDRFAVKRQVVVRVGVQRDANFVIAGR